MVVGGKWKSGKCPCRVADLSFGVKVVPTHGLSQVLGQLVRLNLSVVVRVNLPEERPDVPLLLIARPSRRGGGGATVRV